MSHRIREARPEDVAAILRLVRELAEYEREPDAVEASEDSFLSTMFPAKGAPTVFGHVAEVEGADGPEVVGIAIWFLNFSTWTGTNGIWLEDLYVTPSHRGTGLGKQLLATLARVCVERGYRRLEWTVLNWNEPSIAFYRSLGAVGMEEWTTNRLTGDPLTRLGRAG